MFLQQARGAGYCLGWFAEKIFWTINNHREIPVLTTTATSYSLLLWQPCLLSILPGLPHLPHLYGSLSVHVMCISNSSVLQCTEPKILLLCPRCLNWKSLFVFNNVPCFSGLSTGIPCVMNSVSAFSGSFFTSCHC